ncbi:hypothetical protein SAY86_011562 [Trapa natans]|uniref:Uncharacterized protein n=1 Tax=Trapa natans TaxID=22666 RepID=A0AAN7R0T9_TRANT|nr:hypothetical protein SAY86_011562 [Trapa natans]
MMKAFSKICVKKFTSSSSGSGSSSFAPTAAAIEVDSAGPEARVDLQVEYANAFRTESYVEFWDRVLALSHHELTACQSRQSLGSPATTADRLPSYRLFVDHLLEPDQPTVNRILSSTHCKTSHKSLLSEYFDETANASLLCSALLKDLDSTRVTYQKIKPSSSSDSLRQVQSIQAGCSRLLKQLESARDQVRSKMRVMSRIKNGSATILVALTASLAIIVMTHGLALLMAAPGLLAAASLELASPRRIAKVLVQLDAAAKGTYILKRDMDTISRLVSRLNDELEHMRQMDRFWLERGDDQLQVDTSEEVSRQLNQTDCSFSEQLDELEEHLYLCFMMINRSRNLVLKEIH